MKWKYLDFTIYIDTPKHVRLKRVLERDLYIGEFESSIPIENIEKVESIDSDTYRYDSVGGLNITFVDLVESIYSRLFCVHTFYM